jgi:hypothetical protein
MTNKWSPYGEYRLFVCGTCKSRIMSLLEESVSIPIIYDNGCNTYDYESHIVAARRFITISGLAKHNDDTWKLSNSMRRDVRCDIMEYFS